MVKISRAGLGSIAIASACRHAGPPSIDADVSSAAAIPTSAGALALGVGSASGSVPALALASAAALSSPPALESPPAPAPLIDPFGPPVAIARYTCSAMQRGGPFRSFLAAADMHTAFVDGDDALALVNRSPTGALPPGYAPSDLVDIHDGSAHKPAECDAGRECLRRDAAAALHRMLDAMKAEGLAGRVQSAFRGFGTQCWVFAGWAQSARGGFCEAAEQSALPGHSQHQLGTTLDLFTQEWADEGARTGAGVFRNGFGCTRGGQWLDESAWKFGFVVSYPIHPDDRKDGSRCVARADRSVPIDPKTGYKNEPWHLRFLGEAAAARFHDAWLASAPGSPAEITLEQWLRAERGLVGDAELPVCDGCQCGACATLATDEAKTPCAHASLQLGADGRVVAPEEEPRLLDAHATSRDDAVVLEAAVHAPAHTPTQTPIFGPEARAYPDGATFMALEPYADTKPHAYADLPGAWRVAAEPVPAGPRPWPWRASLAAPELAATWNRANVVLPARAGDATVRLVVAVPRGTQAIRVALLRDGVAHGAIEVPVR